MCWYTLIEKIIDNKKKSYSSYCDFSKFTTNINSINQIKTHKKNHVIMQHTPTL